MRDKLSDILSFFKAATIGETTLFLTAPETRALTSVQLQTVWSKEATGVVDFLRKLKGLQARICTKARIKLCNQFVHDRSDQVIDWWKFNPNDHQQFTSTGVAQWHQNETQKVFEFNPNDCISLYEG